MAYRSCSPHHIPSRLRTASGSALAQVARSAYSRRRRSWATSWATPSSSTASAHESRLRRLSARRYAPFQHFSTPLAAACQHFSGVVSLARGSGEPLRDVLPCDGVWPLTGEADMLKARALKGPKRAEKARSAVLTSDAQQGVAC